MCLNDTCPKCKSKEIQQISARKDLVCEECQKPLRECPPPRSFWDRFGKMIIMAFVAVVVILAAIWYFVLYTPAETGIESEPLDTVVEEPVAVDTLGTDMADTIAVEPAEPVATEPEKTVQPATSPSVQNQSTQQPKTSIQVPFGIYSGPANGLDGEIKVTRQYTLDLRNAAHETIELMPGDVITRTKFKDGELVGGFWHRGTESRSFHR